VTLGAPAALWLLAVLPVIVLLHLLRARRHDVPISSVLLWQRARQDLLAQMPVRRLERSLLLLVQLLAAAVVIMALSRPQVTLPAASSSATVIVLDTSASMQATDVAPSRFDAARTAAIEELAHGTGPVMVIEAGPRPRVASDFGAREIARAALMRLHPTDAPRRLDQAVAMALAQRLNGQATQIIVFTDRAIPAAPGVQYHIVGQTDRNVGIVGVRAERTGEGTVAIVQVRNAGHDAEHVPLTVSLDGRPILDQIVRLPPDATVAVPVRVMGEGILRAHIAPNDSLTVDDTGYAVLGGPPVHVLVVGEQDRTLVEALRAVGVFVMPPHALDAHALAAADVIVLNQTPPAELPPGNYLLLGTTGTNLPLASDGVVRTPEVLRWSHSHPVMRYVDLHDLTIATTLAMQPRGGEVLAEGEVPLIWAYDAQGIRAVIVGFGLHESDLALQVAFPILLRNTLSWLSGVGAAYEAGDPLVVPAGPHAEALLTDPVGHSVVLPARGGQFVVPVLERVGVYTLQVGNRIRQFAINPAPAATEIAPIHPPGGVAAPRSAGYAQRHVDFAPILLLAALFLLAVEWVLWVRGRPRTDLTRFRGAPPLPAISRRNPPRLPVGEVGRAAVRR
jgi:hypothetical protein